ncbi:MAG: ankyrin repeat domain-containing protein [Oligoflexia bacterium]|nr:ankyrin repeat domain-containing protein [Oligoflexia bacterium]
MKPIYHYLILFFLFTIYSFQLLAAGESVDSGIKNKSLEAELRVARTKAIMDAMEKNDVSTVKEILFSNKRNSIDVDAKSSSGQTLLIWAASNNLSTIVEDLIEKGANFDIKNTEGYGALKLATKKGYTDVVKLINEASKLRNSAKEFHQAIKEKNKQKIEEFLKAGVNLESTIWFSNTTPLLKAIKTRDIELVKTLLNKGANPNVKDSSDRTALYYALIRAQDPRMLKVLLEAGADVNLPPENGSSSALELVSWLNPGFANALPYVKVLSDAGALKNKKTVMSAFFAAVRRGQDDAARFFIKNAGIDLNAKDQYDVSLLYWAIYNGNLQMVKELLLAGASLDITSGKGKYALEIAEDYAKKSRKRGYNHLDELPEILKNQEGFKAKNSGMPFEIHKDLLLLNEAIKSKIQNSIKEYELDINYKNKNKKDEPFVMTKEKLLNTSNSLFPGDNLVDKEDYDYFKERYDEIKKLRKDQISDVTFLSELTTLVAKYPQAVAIKEENECNFIFPESAKEKVNSLKEDIKKITEKYIGTKNKFEKLVQDYLGVNVLPESLQKFINASHNESLEQSSTPKRLLASQRLPFDFESIKNNKSSTEILLNGIKDKLITIPYLENLLAIHEHELSKTQLEMIEQAIAQSQPEIQRPQEVQPQQEVQLQSQPEPQQVQQVQQVKYKFTPSAPPQDITEEVEVPQIEVAKKEVTNKEQNEEAVENTMEKAIEKVKIEESSDPFNVSSWPDVPTKAVITETPVQQNATTEQNATAVPKKKLIVVQ